MASRTRVRVVVDHTAKISRVKDLASNVKNILSKRFSTFFSHIHDPLMRCLSSMVDYSAVTALVDVFNAASKEYLTRIQVIVMHLELAFH